MFKSLLRTTPLLTGNISLNCKLVDFTQKDNNTYISAVRFADLLPLQTNLIKYPIDVSLLYNTWDMDVSRFYHFYKDIFYNKNYSINEDDYQTIDKSIYTEVSDRNKDYEFGCKRVSYGMYGFDCNFFAPIYCDKLEDLPDKFCIEIIYDDDSEVNKDDKDGNLIKKIEIPINNQNIKNNLLYIYLKNYLSRIDNKVIYLNNYYKTGIYYGIDVDKGGLCLKTDTVLGFIYNNQTTINNFDNYICEGFKNNNLICRQIIPLSFSFNLDSILTNKEKKYLKYKRCRISGYYAHSTNIKYDFYDLDINYYNYTFETNNYDNNTDVLSVGDSKNIIDKLHQDQNILPEKRLLHNKYFNKIDCVYNKWKLLYSNNEYIVNNHNNFPSFYKYPKSRQDVIKCCVLNKSLILPIFNYNPYTTKNDITELNINNEMITYRNIMIDALINNYSSWFNINNIKSNFRENNNYDNIIYGDVIDNKILYNGVLYNFENEDTNGPINKFAIIIDIHNNDNEDENADDKRITFYKIDNTLLSDEDKKIYNKEESLLYVVSINIKYLVDPKSYNIYNNIDTDVISSINDELIYNYKTHKYYIDTIVKYFIYLNVYLNDNMFLNFKKYFKDFIIDPSSNNVTENFNPTLLSTNDDLYKGIFYDNDDTDKRVYSLVYFNKFNVPVLRDEIISSINDINSIRNDRQINTYEVSRYFNFILPVFDNVSKNKYIIKDRFHLYFKEHNVKNTYGENNIYNKDININKYLPIKYINKDNKLVTDINDRLKYNFEHKHYINNIIYNLEKEIIIKYDGELTYDELLIQENHQNSLNIFKNYIKNKINIKNNEHIFLFLFNKYKLNFLSKDKYTNILGDKIYELTYKFTLI